MPALDTSEEAIPRIAPARPGENHPFSPVPADPRPVVSARPLPMSMEEARERGWDEIDIVFISGDAYLDHPSFAAGILGRVLEANGYRVGIVAQPDWKNCEAWKTFGRPRLFFAVSAGNMDSMINHYTANRKVRNDDAYSPGGKIGLRPDRATLPYCQRAREAYKGVPIIAGGVEASLRRLAHYDYWSDKVRRSMVLDAKADLVVYGMGESAVVEVARRLDAGETVQDLRSMRGVAYALGAKESFDETREDLIVLPSFEEAVESKTKFADMTRLIHQETNPYNARTLVQRDGQRWVVQTPQRLPEPTKSMDFFYGLPYTRKAHPSYEAPIPAHQVIKDSVTIMRGCFGGCTYCSITTHQGRVIQSRSKESIVREVEKLGKDPEFKGTISDLGGPTANMYKMRCKSPKVESICRRLSCVHPKVCPLLETDHSELIELMRETREKRGVKRVHIASGVRMDLARSEPEYLKELAQHHVGGHLKVAQEHSDPETLTRMKRPSVENFEDFDDQFQTASRDVGKEQYLVPYFITAHPGTDLKAMIELAVFLKKNGYKPEQVQDFIPAPFDVAACMYHTGLDPMTMKPVLVAKLMRERKAHRALLQFFKPENYFEVRKALEKAGRKDLIGNDCNALIPSRPPARAIEARMARAAKDLAKVDEDHVHSTRRSPDARGYRPHRSSAKRRSRPGNQAGRKSPKK